MTDIIKQLKRDYPDTCREIYVRGTQAETEMLIILAYERGRLDQLEIEAEAIRENLK